MKGEEVEAVWGSPSIFLTIMAFKKRALLVVVGTTCAYFCQTGATSILALEQVKVLWLERNAKFSSVGRARDKGRC